MIELRDPLRRVAKLCPAEVDAQGDQQLARCCLGSVEVVGGGRQRKHGRGLARARVGTGERVLEAHAEGALSLTQH